MDLVILAGRRVRLAIDCRWDLPVAVTSHSLWAMNPYHFFLAASALALGATVHAAPQEYTFKDPKKVNHVVFMLDAPLEFISGTGREIDGTVTFDPANPAATTGTITLAANSLSVPNATMQDHMHGGDWLNVGENPLITIEVTEFKPSSTDGDRVGGTVMGTMTLLGTTQEISVPATITYVKDGARDRERGEGDLVVVRSDFTFKLSDYGLKLNAAQRLKVSDEVQIRAVLAGRPAGE